MLQLLGPLLKNLWKLTFPMLVSFGKTLGVSQRTFFSMYILFIHEWPQQSTMVYNCFTYSRVQKST